MRGEGPHAEASRALFETTCRRLGLNQAMADDQAPRAPTFRRPGKAGDQLTLL
jgi:hypothetical protein